MDYSPLWVWRGNSKEGFPSGVLGDWYFQIDTNKLFIFQVSGWKVLFEGEVLATAVLPEALADVVEQAEEPPPPMA
jgi:hypothetical protein